ncbi:hypothetical protein PHYBOEH_000951 [Phytophthora boehmeriae]|uniref:BD-FAE-like domain-containing protein n=1 Tax=Phytophthora boehmeriae TaxID=109152 RepID=A0A8T1WV26_9STRA|nr:hypothetical protein PHYBOEH_000951 [Phytophthora boehmeriae]
MPEPQLRVRNFALTIAALAYLRHTGRSLSQHHALLQMNDPRLPWTAHVKAVLKYTSMGQLISGSEFLLCLVKPQLATRIGRLLLWKSRGSIANCRYGPNARNTLDVYGVEENGPPRPVLVFVHGGAWSFGHKWQYGLVGEYLATQGFLVAVINYRTYPHGSIADMVQDVENAVFWIAENCNSLGGDNCKLFLSGHSSGGHVGALALVNSALRVATNGSKEKEIVNYVQGFIGLAAPYDISDHYIFESERVVGPFNGVHEISSMKPAMLGKNNFEMSSPTALVAKARTTSFSLPRFFLLHGADDEVVPPEASIKFATSLKQAGEAAAYCEINNCTHEGMVFAAMGDPVECRSDVINLIKRIIFSRIESQDTTIWTPFADTPIVAQSRL